MTAAGRRVATMALAGAALAALIIGVNSRGSVDAMTYGDGEIARAVAQHWTTPVDELPPGIRERGPSLRFGRAGLPALLWLASAGQDAAMRFTQPLLMIAMGAAAAAAVPRLLPGAGPLGFVIPFLAPGFAVSVSGGYTEALAVPLSMWAVARARAGVWWHAAALVGAALLVKENAVVVLAGLALFAIVDRRRDAFVPLAVSVVPVAAWHLVVRQRYGHLPVADPWLDPWSAPGPVLALVRAITEPLTGLSLGLALGHIGLAALAIALVRRSRYAWLAAAASVQLLVAGPPAWEYAADAMRVSSFIQVWLVVAVADVVMRRREAVAA